MPDLHAEFARVLLITANKNINESWLLVYGIKDICFWTAADIADADGSEIGKRIAQKIRECGRNVS